MNSTRPPLFHVYKNSFIYSYYYWYPLVVLSYCRSTLGEGLLLLPPMRRCSTHGVLILENMLFEIEFSSRLHSVDLYKAPS